MFSLGTEGKTFQRSPEPRETVGDAIAASPTCERPMALAAKGKGGETVCVDGKREKGGEQQERHDPRREREMMFGTMARKGDADGLSGKNALFKRIVWRGMVMAPRERGPQYIRGLRR